MQACLTPVPTPTPIQTLIRTLTLSLNLTLTLTPTLTLTITLTLIPTLSDLMDSAGKTNPGALYPHGVMAASTGTYDTLLSWGYGCEYWDPTYDTPLMIIP